MIYIDGIPYIESDNDYIRSAVIDKIIDWNVTVSTSGTTGHPKTVHHSKELIKQISEFNTEWFGLDSRSIMFQLYSPRGIAFTTMSLYPALLADCDLYIETEVGIKYIDRINEIKPTHTLVLPNVYKVLNQHRKWKDIDYSSCKQVLMGSDYTPKGALQELRSKGAQKVYNVYGATEVPPNVFMSEQEDVYGNIQSPLIDYQIKDNELWVKYKLQDDWWQSGDLVEPCENHFKLVGRKLNMFKLGDCGTRVYPEQIEKCVVDAGADLALCRNINDKCIIYYTGTLHKQVDVLQDIKYTLVNVETLKVDNNLRKIDRTQVIK